MATWPNTDVVPSSPKHCRHVIGDPDADLAVLMATALDAYPEIEFDNTDRWRTRCSGAVRGNCV
jgi:hypothetical protein